MLYDNDIIEHDGSRFRVTFPYDDIDDAPWEREDGHGDISDWKRHAFGQGTKPPKAAGELILCWDHGSYRTYDFAGACKIARRDGWGWLPGDLKTAVDDLGTWHASAGSFHATGSDINTAVSRLYAAHRASMSPKAYAAEAARRDFEFLRDWCENRWCYVGVVVELVDDDDEPTGETESVGGIESNAYTYLEETAHELAGELLANLKSRAA